ncbi:hypothetical protein ANRL4_03172 [Anaerolineae bacterium]|nr:hypothetical protein ANRL4_03172 [Anaerolineae bacterium]
MNFMRHADAHSFLEIAQPVLMRNEARNNLMLGITIILKTQPDRFKSRPYLVTVQEGEALTAAYMTPPHKLSFYSDAPDPLPALERIAQDLYQEQWLVSGVSGHPPLPAHFASIWEKLTGAKATPGMHMGIYELRQVVVPPYAVSGRLFRATMDDLDLVTEWTHQFNMDTFGHGDQEEARGASERRIKFEEVYLWSVEGYDQPVSMAAKGRAMPTGCAVNLVYTPPQFRGKGFATSCVAALSQFLLDSGFKFCALFTDMANPTSNSIYQKIGYRWIGDFTEFHFSPPK